MNKQEEAKAKRDRKASKTNATKYAKMNLSPAGEGFRQGWKTTAELKAEAEKRMEAAQLAAEEAAKGKKVAEEAAKVEEKVPV